jgi:hypothetical protein
VPHTDAFKAFSVDDVVLVALGLGLRMSLALIRRARGGGRQAPAVQHALGLHIGHSFLEQVPVLVWEWEVEEASSKGV